MICRVRRGFEEGRGSQKFVLSFKKEWDCGYSRVVGVTSAQNVYNIPWLGALWLTPVTGPSSGCILFSLCFHSVILVLMLLSCSKWSLQVVQDGFYAIPR